MKVRMIVAVGVLALLATACFDDERTTRVFDPTPQIAAAPAAIREAGTMRIATSFNFGSAGATVSGRGEVDFRRHLATFSIRPAPGAPRISFLYTRDSIYTRTPEQLLTLTEGRPWVRLSRTVNSGAEAGPFGFADPTALLASLAGASGGWIYQAEEDVRGVKTTHYSVNIDLKLAEQVTTGSEQEAVRSLARALNKEHMLVDVWLASSGEVPRLAIDLGEGQSVVRVQMDFSALGEPVSIRVPRRAETKTLRTEQEISNFFTALGSGG